MANKNPRAVQNYHLQNIINSIKMVRRPEIARQQARDNQIDFAAKAVQVINALCVEAEGEQIPTPGLLEARDWLIFGMEENGLMKERDAEVSALPDDPLKDAKVSSILAAMTNDPVRYAAARAHEAEVFRQTEQDANHE